jgi:ParB family transcriptional regulator, chromosome partitioning protein
VARLGGLGKGLGALIPPGETVDGVPIEETRLSDVAIDSIVPNPHQPRVHFDEVSLNDLTASIREIGVLQPVLVRPVGDTYELLAGERRWRAAKRAGLAVIPAIIRQTDDLGSVEQALVENLHRQDLTPLEEAAAFQQLIEDFHLTHEQVATRVGKSRSAITNTLRLMSLPPSIQHLLADGRLSAGHARALLGTPDRAFQEQLARRASQEGWSVRAVEEAVRDRGQSTDVDAAEESDAAAPGNSPGPTRPAGSKLRPPGLLELEDLLAERLSTAVSVTMGARRGRLVVDFADLEDLERLYHLMSGASDPLAQH